VPILRIQPHGKCNTERTICRKGDFRFSFGESMTILLFALMAIPNTLAGVAKWQLIWAIVGVVFSALTIEDRNDPLGDFAGKVEASLILIHIFTFAWWFLYLSCTLGDMGSQALIDAGWKK